MSIKIQGIFIIETYFKETLKEKKMVTNMYSQYIIYYKTNTYTTAVVLTIHCTTYYLVPGQVSV